MPCRPWEEDAQITELPHPERPTKPPGNDGASHDNSDAEIPVTKLGRGIASEKEEEARIAAYYIVKRWVMSRVTRRR